MWSGSRVVAAGRSGFLGYIVFMLCVSTTAIWRRCRGGSPQQSAGMGPGAIFHSALRSGSGLETNGIKSLEVSKPRYWYKKFPNRSEIGKANLLLCCWSTYQISNRLDNYINLFEISQNLTIRHLNSFFNRASTGRILMLMKKIVTLLIHKNNLFVSICATWLSV